MQPEMLDEHLLGVFDRLDDVGDQRVVIESRSIDVLEREIRLLELIAQPTGTGPLVGDSTPWALIHR